MRCGHLFTFLSSFFFIRRRAFIESTHGNPETTAALTGITAAVVGVIVNSWRSISLWHVLWLRRPSVGRLTRPRPLIGRGAAGFALFRLKAGVIPTVAASAVAGLAWRMLAAP